MILLYQVPVLFLLHQVDLDSRHIGWVTSELPGGDNQIIKIELKGPENTLRVRQVKVLGWKDGESTKIAGQISASVAQQRSCEAETLRVFRLITSQVSDLRVNGPRFLAYGRYFTTIFWFQIQPCSLLLGHYQYLMLICSFREAIVR